MGFSFSLREAPSYMDIKRCGHTLNIPFSAMTSHGHHARSYPHAPPQTTSILQFTVQPVCPTTSPLHPLIAPFTWWSSLRKLLSRGSSISWDFLLCAFASRCKQPTSFASSHWPCLLILGIGTDHCFSARGLCHPAGSSCPGGGTTPPGWLESLTQLCCFNIHIS